nr:MAG TPA: hypothetical protein [Caudoviricetes sp.]
MIVKIRRLNLLRFIFLFLCENQLHIYSTSVIFISTYGKAPHVNAVLCLHLDTKHCAGGDRIED